MAEVTMTLNGRTYRLECDDGEEEHLLALSEVVGARLRTHQQQFGQVGDDRLLLMTALTIADELSEANRKLDEIASDQQSADEKIRQAEVRYSEKMEEAAERIEVLSAALNDSNAAQAD